LVSLSGSTRPNARHLIPNYRLEYALRVNLMKHASIDQLKVLIDSLDDVSLNISGRIEVLQKIRQSAASLYFNRSNNTVGHSEQIDVMVLEAIEVALLPVERESSGHINTGLSPAAGYIQP